jgi:hypothetical protein
MFKKRKDKKGAKQAAGESRQGVFAGFLHFGGARAIDAKAAQKPCVTLDHVGQDSRMS